jgi:energy-coupling factor transporter ATP-binding protein EcfA2
MTSMILRFEHVHYTYPESPQPALRDVSLAIEEGAFVLVAGASGTGKSTLLRAINGLVPHFHGGTWQGRVFVDGRDTRMHEPRALADVVGFVFQDPEAQAVVDVVEDELVFGMENLGLEPPLMRRRVEEVLDQLEISHLRRRQLSTLSGGERQRVAIAAVLTTQPRVLVLDEPTSQLDPHAAEEVLTALQKLNVDLGLTIILSEHRLERVVQYVDQIIFFNASDQGGDAPQFVIGPPQAVLQSAPFAPPLVELARTLGWQPLPLTLKAARRFLASVTLPAPPADSPSSSPARWWRSAHRHERAVEPALLEISGLRVQLAGREVVHNVELNLKRGEIVALMGRNGSGKTTVLRSIMGLAKHVRGEIRLGGRDIGRMPVEERSQHIGYVPQDPRILLFHPTVREELRWTLTRAGTEHSEEVSLDQRVDAVLALLGLEHLATMHPRDLSAGQQQRVALATVLVREVAVLLLDEPTRGLDYLNKNRLTQSLQDLSRSGHAVLLVTHDVELVAVCADRVVLMGDGEVVTAGPTRTLLRESLIFSSQIGKLFPRYGWLTADDARVGLAPATNDQRPTTNDQRTAE